MNDTIAITNRKLRQGHLVVTGITFAILACSLALVGELNDLLVWLLVIIAAIAVPVVFLHVMLVEKLLAPARSLLERNSEQASPSQAEGVEALIALERYHFRDEIYSFIWWVGGAIVLGAVLFALQRITGWQLFVLLCHGVAAGLIDTLLSMQVNAVSLRKLQDEIETYCSVIRSSHHRLSGLTHRMVWTFLMVGVLIIGLSSLFWFSQLRTLRGQDLVAGKEGQFYAVVEFLTRTLKSEPSLPPGQLVKRVEPAELRKGLIVASLASGVILSGSSEASGTEVTAAWVKRIAEETIKAETNEDRGGIQEYKDTRWPSVRAPFLFMARPIGRDNLLMWVGSVDMISKQMGLQVWIIVAGAVMLLVVCAVLAWSIASTSLSQVSSLRNWIQKIDKGDFGARLEVGGQGHMALLARSLEDLTLVMHKQRQHDEQIGGQLQESQSTLFQQLTVLSEGSDKSSEMAEQTASGMIEMRASIQSISEQVDSLRDMASECSSSMLQIDQSVREVAAAAENLQTQVDDTVSAISEIGISMGEVASNVDQLNTLTEESAGAIASMDASNKRVEESSSETHRLSQEVSEIARRGAESVEQTIAGINEIRSVTDEARDVINRLGNQVGAVGKILTVIGDVAAQTNLLALNAAIIAASAGEYGKGFAVVAEEIKDLADRTSSSTKEIAGLIKAVQAESRRAVDAMERGTGSVRRGVELANNAGQSLQQILSSVQQASQKANEISKSTVEHSAISRRMTKLMADVSEMTQSIKRAVGEQARAGTRIGRVGEKMREEAHFVLRSTNEQSQAASGVSRNFERVSELIGAISRALTEQAQGVNHIAKAAEGVRDTLQQDKTQMSQLAQLSERIGSLATSMTERIRDSVDGEGVPDESN